MLNRATVFVTELLLIGGQFGVCLLKLIKDCNWPIHTLGPVEIATLLHVGGLKLTFIDVDISIEFVLTVNSAPLKLSEHKIEKQCLGSQLRGL